MSHPLWLIHGLPTSPHSHRANSSTPMLPPVSPSQTPVGPHSYVPTSSPPGIFWLQQGQCDSKQQHLSPPQPLCPHDSIAPAQHMWAVPGREMPSWGHHGTVPNMATPEGSICPETFNLGAGSPQGPSYSTSTQGMTILVGRWATIPKRDNGAASSLHGSSFLPPLQEIRLGVSLPGRSPSHPSSHIGQPRRSPVQAYTHTAVTVGQMLFIGLDYGAGMRWGT